MGNREPKDDPAELRRAWMKRLLGERGREPERPPDPAALRASWMEHLRTGRNAADWLPPDRQAKPSTRKAIPQATKVAVAARDSGRCQCMARSCGHVGKCGSTVEPHFDHIIPWSKGGTDTVGNLQILCGPCNRRKGALDNEPA